MSKSDAPALTVESTKRYRRHVEEAAAFLRERASSLPTRALVLGTEVSGIADALNIDDEWELGELPHFPAAGEEETGRLAIGTFGGAPVLVLNGALSLHDGYTPRQVVFPVRVLAEAGVGTVCFANAAGSVDPRVEPSDLFLVTDHINFQGVNPLVGPNVEAWGPRFPDMSEPYDPALRALAEEQALQEGIGLQQGVYCAVLGPNRGTPAEYRMMQTLGADVVGMDTVPEVIAARHMDLRVLAISVITDQCASGVLEPVSTEERTDAIEAARPALRRLLRAVLGALDKEEVPV